MSEMHQSNRPTLVWYSWFAEDKVFFKGIKSVSQRYAALWRNYSFFIKKSNLQYSNQQIQTIFSNFVDSLAIEAYEDEKYQCSFKDFISIYCLSKEIQSGKTNPPWDSNLWIKDKSKIKEFLINSIKKLETEINEFMNNKQKLAGKEIDFYLTKDLNLKYEIRLGELMRKNRMNLPLLSSDVKEMRFMEIRLNTILELFAEIIKLDVFNDTTYCNTYDSFNERFCNNSRIFIGPYDFELIKNIFRTRENQVIFDEKSILFNKTANEKYIEYVIFRLEKILSELKNTIEPLEFSIGSDELPYFGGEPLNENTPLDTSEKELKLRRDTDIKTSQNVVETVELIEEIKQKLIQNNWGNKTIIEKNRITNNLSLGANFATVEDLELIFSISTTASTLLKQLDESKFVYMLRGYKALITKEKFPNFNIFKEESVFSILSNLKRFKLNLSKHYNSSITSELYDR
ncbi:hypothetical protein KO317_03965 [Candidatus Micrarchaeota archaeon]|nr:hypothetical protein [Candidatus Micrarchaeota archaeon]